MRVCGREGGEEKEEGESGVRWCVVVCGGCGVVVHDCGWLVVGGWWLAVGRWAVGGGWWLVVGGWWLVFWCFGVFGVLVTH